MTLLPLTSWQALACRKRRPALFMAALVLCLSLPFFATPYVLHIAISGALLAAGVMPLTVLSGTAGLLSLGYAAFSAIGGFTAGLLQLKFGIGIFPAAVAAGLLGFLVGGLLGLVTLRINGLYLSVATLALHHVVLILATDIDVKLTYSAGFTLTAPALLGIDIDTPLKWWGVSAGLAVLIYAYLTWLVRRHFGREWVFMREDASAAQAMGVDIFRRRTELFALTSGITAVTGVFAAYYLGNVQAGTYTLQMIIISLTVVAIGGAGSLLGTVLGAYLVLLIPVMSVYLSQRAGLNAAAWIGGVENILLGIVLTGAVLYMMQANRRTA